MSIMLFRVIPGSIVPTASGVEMALPFIKLKIIKLIEKAICASSVLLLQLQYAHTIKKEVFHLNSKDVGIC